MAEVTLKDIRKSYGAVDVIKGVDIDIKDGEFCVFVGPSGCGKSTLLRMIAGLRISRTVRCPSAGGWSMTSPPKNAAWAWCSSPTPFSRI